MSPAPRKKSPAAKSSGHLDDIVDDAQSLSSSVGEAVDEVYQNVAQEATKHPYRTLGAAAGVGFVLAGGLTPRIAGLAMSMGSKWLLGQLRDQIMPRSDAS